MLLFLTGWYIFFPHSKLVYKIFPSLPSGIMINPVTSNV